LKQPVDQDQETSYSTPIEHLSLTPSERSRGFTRTPSPYSLPSERDDGGSEVTPPRIKKNTRENVPEPLKTKNTVEPSMQITKNKKSPSIGSRKNIARTEREDTDRKVSAVVEKSKNKVASSSSSSVKSREKRVPSPVKSIKVKQTGKVKETAVAVVKKVDSKPKATYSKSIVLTPRVKNTLQF